MEDLKGLLEKYLNKALLRIIISGARGDTDITNFKRDSLFSDGDVSGSEGFS